MTSLIIAKDRMHSFDVSSLLSRERVTVECWVLCADGDCCTWTTDIGRWTMDILVTRTVAQNYSTKPVYSLATTGILLLFSTPVRYAAWHPQLPYWIPCRWLNYSAHGSHQVVMLTRPQGSMPMPHVPFKRPSYNYAIGRSQSHVLARRSRRISNPN